MHPVIKYFVASLVFIETIAHGVILDEIVNGGRQVGESVDCGLTGFGNFLGLGQQKPCSTNSQPVQQFVPNNQIIWNLDNQENLPRTTPKQQNFGIWNFEQPTGFEQNGRTQNGNGFTTDKKSVSNFHNSVPENKEEVVSPHVPKQVEPTTQATKTPPKLGPNNGRRIISARANCPEGYVADARGRCREIM